MCSASEPKARSSSGSWTVNAQGEWLCVLDGALKNWVATDAWWVGELRSACGHMHVAGCLVKQQLCRLCQSCGPISDN